MKKILSIFAINSILVSSVIFAGAGIACDNSKPNPPVPPKPKPKPSIPWKPLTPSKPIPPKPKLILNNLKFYNINVTKNSAGNTFIINGINAYKKIENDIIQEYDKIIPNPTLSLNNFNSNSTSIDNSKTWAVQILNVNNSKTIANALNQQLIFPDKNEYNVLNNNALKVIITTNDPNTKTENSLIASTKQVQVNGYLNKFIYTNKNLNKGKYISNNVWKTASENNLTINNVIDLSQGTYHINFTTLNFNSSIVDLREELFSLNQNQRALISKAIVSNLNKQLKPETKDLNSSGELSIAQNNVPIANAININNTNTKLYTVYANDEFNQIQDYDNGNLGSGWKIFIKIKIGDWNYLQNYLTTKWTSVYLYLGSVSLNTQKWNLNNFEIFDIDGLSKNDFNSIWINGGRAYETIATTIANEYNFLYNPSTFLIPGDFEFNSTSLAQKTWAIQILNINGTPTIDKYKFQSLVAGAGYTCLRDNYLNATITTNDLNVANKTSTIKIYLNKFIYSNANANKGNNVLIDTGATLTKENVIDLTSSSFDPIKKKYTLSSTNSVNQLLNQLQELKPRFKTQISSQIVLNLNTQLGSETQYLNAQGKLAIANNSVVKPQEYPFNINDLKIYCVDTNNNVTHPSGEATLGSAGLKVFAQLDISNWNYLHNYLGANNSFVYLYLGTIR